MSGTQTESESESETERTEMHNRTQATGRAGEKAHNPSYLTDQNPGFTIPIEIPTEFSTRALTSWLRVVGASRRSVVWCPPLGGARSARRCDSPPGIAPLPTAAPSPAEPLPLPVPTSHVSKTKREIDRMNFTGISRNALPDKSIAKWRKTVLCNLAKTGICPKMRLHELQHICH